MRRLYGWWTERILLPRAYRVYVLVLTLLCAPWAVATYWQWLT